ncbi:hypothetical protein IMZ48_21670, partial [Candidatus Bathyarchaeota archaeon]|nr:hypothetical protein [Candidatus Bathyarchaeota archaeon]
MQRTRLPHVASQLRAERSMRNRRCNALTLDLDSLSTTPSDPPAGAGHRFPAWRPAPGNDDVDFGEMGRVVIGDTDHPSPSPAAAWHPDSRKPAETSGIDWIFEDGRCWTDDGEDACSESDVTTAPSTPNSLSASEAGTTTPRSPSPVEHASSMSSATTPETAPRPPPWGSFQRFSFQKGPASCAGGARSASPGGRGASAAAERLAGVDSEGAGGIGIGGVGAQAHDVGTSPGPGGNTCADHYHYLYSYAPARPHPEDTASAQQAPEPIRPTPARELKTSPSGSKRGRFLASAVTVVPVTARATCITLSTSSPIPEPEYSYSGPTPREFVRPKHDLDGRRSSSPIAMQHHLESQPVGTITPAAGTVSPRPHPDSEPSIAQQLHAALEDTIATDSDGSYTFASNHTESAGGRWTPVSRSRGPSWTPLSRGPTAPALPPPDDEGPLFNFSRPAASAANRGPPRSTAPSPIPTPHPDVLTPGKASAPTSPTAAHFLASTPTVHSSPSPRMQNPLYHGSGYPREPLARARAAESTASFRSHCTASTAPVTCATGRSSVTRGTSVTSVASVEDEEPIVDEVMRMYEKGFYDDTDEEESESEKAPIAIHTRREKGPLAIDTSPTTNTRPSIDTRPATAASAHSQTAAARPIAANQILQSAPASPLSCHPPFS